MTLSNAPALGQLSDAMLAHPELVSGTGRQDLAIMRAKAAFALMALYASTSSIAVCASALSPARRAACVMNAPVSARYAGVITR